MRVNTITYGAILSVNNHICLVLSGQLFCLPNGCILTPVFRRNTFIPLTPYGPTVFMWYHMLVPGPSPFALTRTFKKDLCQLNYNVCPGSGFVAFCHTAFFTVTEDTIFNQEFRISRFFILPMQSFLTAHRPLSEQSFRKTLA